MFLAFLCAQLSLLLFHAKAAAFNDSGNERGPLSLMALEMVDNVHINYSSFPAECFPSEGNSTANVTNLRRRRLSSTTEASETTYSASENLKEEADTNFTSVHHDADMDMSHLSQEFLSCMLWAVDKGCYQMLPNLSAYVPLYNRSFGYSDYLVVDDELLICPNALVEDYPRNYSLAFVVVSNVGLIISIICIVLHMVMFILVDALRNLPGCCLISLCVSLVIGYTSFIVVQLTQQDNDCTPLGMLMYYSFESSFFWMNILSYDVWRSLRMATSKLRLNSNFWLRFYVYSAYCWGSPGLIMISGIVINKLGEVSRNARFIFSPLTCWFAFKKALLLYFALPFFLLFFMNCVFFVWSFFLITSASMRSVENRSMLWSRFCIFLRLAIIMGLGWIFGVIAAATEIHVFWYCFVLFNTTQGVLIFFSFSFGQKTRNAWKSRTQKRNNSSTPTQYSSQSQSVSHI